ncbi:hypothetical protein ACRR98_004205 [Escherichia coli]
MAEYLQRFFVGGLLEGLCFSLGRSPYARREAVGGTFISALAAASEGIFVIIHSCFKDKYFPCGEATQGIKEQGLRIYCGFDVLCLLLSEVISLRVFVDNRRRFYSDTLLRASKNCQSGTK